MFLHRLRGNSRCSLKQPAFNFERFALRRSLQVHIPALSHSHWPTWHHSFCFSELMNEPIHSRRTQLPKQTRVTARSSKRPAYQESAPPQLKTRDRASAQGIHLLFPIVATTMKTRTDTAT